MAKPRIDLKSREIDKYLKSPQMRREMLRRAQQVARRAGPGYEASAVIGRTRARASVITGTYAAMRDNSRRNTLLRSLRG